ncbi:MAG: Hpt domain-containing protein [Desulfovibrio sp.]|jgi:HPt (histidine-containing phosphotransfer) domain-containing protein|nr:Hpt domain-containing protein [Desulfovibrio sp.]
MVQTVATDEGEGAGKTPLRIPGVNVEAWLKNAGGALALYLDVLAIFCRHAEEKSAEILEAAEKGDLRRYTILVHGIKGAARAINADAFAARAQEMEQAGDNGELSTVKEKTGGLLADLGALIGEIRAGINARAEEKNAGDVDLRIGELKKALRATDITTVNVLLARYATMSLDAESRNAVTEVDRHVLYGEYEEAIKTLERFWPRDP